MRRRAMRPGRKQAIKNQLNRLSEQFRRERVQLETNVPVGISILDQDDIKATPIIRYRHVCQGCLNSFIADSQEATCRSCGNYRLSVEPIAKSGARD